LEFADVGIVSVYSKSEAEGRVATENLRKTRALCGLGLRFAEIAALDFPAFLNRERTLAYEAAVFENNARFAREVSRANQLFEDHIHPALKIDFGRAPYCILQLRDSKCASYEHLEKLVRERVEAAKVKLECGGSFGFRGHRYELVRPDDAPPFLRVALGRRGGVSLQRVIDLFVGIAKLDTV
jgi:hypothetical protein